MHLQTFFDNEGKDYSELSNCYEVKQHIGKDRGDVFQRKHTLQVEPYLVSGKMRANTGDAAAVQ